MNNTEFRAFLDLLMCSDPWPVKPDNNTQYTLIKFADKESQNRGFTDWIEAYHKMDVFDMDVAYPGYSDAIDQNKGG